MLTRTEFQQIETALETMGGLNVANGSAAGDLYVPVQNVKVLIATFVQGAVKEGPKVRFPVVGGEPGAQAEYAPPPVDTRDAGVPR